MRFSSAAREVARSFMLRFLCMRIFLRPIERTMHWISRRETVSIKNLTARRKLKNKNLPNEPTDLGNLLNTEIGIALVVLVGHLLSHVLRQVHQIVLRHLGAQSHQDASV